MDWFGLGGSEGYTITNTRGVTTHYDSQGRVTQTSTTPSQDTVPFLSGLKSALLMPLSWTKQALQDTEFFSFSQGEGGLFDQEQKNIDRLDSKLRRDPTGQSTDGACQWWNVICKTQAAASGVNSWFQSTLTKILVTVIVVAVLGIFLLSFVQAKAGRLAQ